MSAPNLSHLVAVFGRIGLLSFGGPAAQIALMHRELVETRPWLEERQFLHALSFCMLLPGPEATQLATYAGWRLRGWRGGLIGGLLFVLPGAAVILVLAYAYALFGEVPLVEALFLGVKAAVVVIVVEALIRLARKTLHRLDRWVIAGLSFLAIFALQLPFPLIIALAALYGGLTQGAAEGPAPRLGEYRTLRTAALGLTAWLAPLAALWLAGADFLLEVGLFFSKLAVVTFGGAYAVLAYMTQEVVSTYGWITTPEMIDGLGLAETTPGPLILVTQFVGMLAGFHAGGPGLALAAGVVTLWVTFAPCFLWIFAGAPYLDWIASRPRLTGALSAITAAVVGVILNLSLWFGLHVLFADVGTTAWGPLSLARPDPGSLDPRAAGLAALAAALLFGLRWELTRLIPALAAAGLVFSRF